jgi:hypothetical protein
MTRTRMSMSLVFSCLRQASRQEDRQGVKFVIFE